MKLKLRAGIAVTALVTALAGGVSPASALCVDSNGVNPDVTGSPCSQAGLAVGDNTTSSTATNTFTGVTGTTAVGQGAAAGDPTKNFGDPTNIGETALGALATSTGQNSVALGAKSTDGGQANVVSVGGVGSERRITNVAPGTNGTDAV